MTIAFRASTSITGTGPDPSVTKPTGVVDGDIMFAIAWCSNSVTMTAPAGWTALGAAMGPTPSGNVARGWYRIANSEGASYTWGTGGAGVAVLRVAIAAWSGNGLTFGETNQSTNETSGSPNAVAGSLTVTNAGVHVILQAIYNGGISATSTTPPSGYTEEVDTASGSTIIQLVVDWKAVSAGATGSQTIVMSNNSFGNGEGAYINASFYELSSFVAKRSLIVNQAVKRASYF